MMLQPQLSFRSQVCWLRGKAVLTLLTCSPIFQPQHTPMPSVFLSFHFSAPPFLSSPDFQCFVLSTSILFHSKPHYFLPSSKAMHAFYFLRKSSLSSSLQSPAPKHLSSSSTSQTDGANRQLVQAMRNLHAKKEQSC